MAAISELWLFGNDRDELILSLTKAGYQTSKFPEKPGGDWYIWPEAKKTVNPAYWSLKASHFHITMQPEHDPKSKYPPPPPGRYDMKLAVLTIRPPGITEAQKKEMEGPSSAEYNKHGCHLVPHPSSSFLESLDSYEIKQIYGRWGNLDHKYFPPAMHDSYENEWKDMLKVLKDAFDHVFMDKWDLGTVNRDEMKSWKGKGNANANANANAQDHGKGNVGKGNVHVKGIGNGYKLML